MQAIEKIKKICFYLATCGYLGEWWLGGLVASVFAIPLILLFQSIYWLSPTIFWWFLVAVVVLLLITVQMAVMFDNERAARVVVLDKIVGVMIALAGVPLKWRVIFFGFILFHILNAVQPSNWYRKIVRSIEKLPGLFGIFGAELFAALLVNISLRLIAWVMG